MSPDPGQRNCAIEMYWQFGPATPELRAVLEVLEAWLTEPAFDQLRTKKTLGYSVDVGYRNTNETLGFGLTVASSTHTAEALLLLHLS